MTTCETGDLSKSAKRASVVTRSSGTGASTGPSPFVPTVRRDGSGFSSGGGFQESNSSVSEAAGGFMLLPLVGAKCNQVKNQGEVPVAVCRNIVRVP